MSEKWVLLQRQVPIDEIIEVRKSEYKYVAIIIHNPELYVDGRAYISMQIDPENEEICILKREQKTLIDEQAKSMHDSDACMWSYFGTPTIPPRRARLRGVGCRTLMLELFCGVMTLTYMGSQADWPESQPSDAMLDGLDLTKKSDRDEIDRQIERDDPILLVMAFPCGPWNPWTTFNAARSHDYAVKVDQVRREHTPMLKWVAESAGKRIHRGRIVLLENGWKSEALRLPCFQKLIDIDRLRRRRDVPMDSWRSMHARAEGCGLRIAISCLHSMGHK